MQEEPVKLKERDYFKEVTIEAIQKMDDPYAILLVYRFVRNITK